MKQYLEQIDQLLDGELDQMHESALFAELSVNSDLRQEMRDHLAIRSAVKDDRMALVPPAMLTNSVFSGLGFAAPFAGAAATTIGTSVVWQWLTRLGIPLLSALTAAGVSWGVASGTFADFVATSGATVEQPAQQAQEATSTRDEGPNAAVATPAVAGSASSDQSTDALALEASQQRERELRRQLALRNDQISELRTRIANIENAQVVAQTAPVQEKESDEILTAELPDRIPLTSSIVLSNTYTVQRPNEPQSIRLTPYDANSAFSPFKKFSLQIRGMSLSPSVATTVSEQDEWYSNLGFAALYHMSAQSALGMEVGNEAYPMVFEGSRNGQIVRYEQFPTTMWAGITYRYTASPFGTFPLAPFGQVLVGGSKFGPMGRAQVGVQYAPIGPLSFLLGFEGSAMTFTYQNKTYISPKFGLTYGMAFRF